MNKKPHKKLGQLASTAICGNDITSSCLYVCALAIAAGGRWGPVALLLVAAVLYLFRPIYAEVVGALPLNGGAYNALLNTTSKFRASIAACLTILSYMATAVISAGEGMHYLHNIFHGLPVEGATIGLLAFFAILTIIGITESAAVAIGIFIFHLTSLVFLSLVCGYALITQGTELLMQNLATPTQIGPAKALFFSFCAAMLGVSGFESSANFVEEQEDGVFPKTLRNMWIAVSIFNPLLALLALGVLPIHEIASKENAEALLAIMGHKVGGNTLSRIISIDAVLVLSGAVLTSFVGVNGLVKRMALDRCLPQNLLKETKQGTTPRIIIAFFLLTVSVYKITDGDIGTLAGVYTLSFLSVMVLFGYGNILLKVRRSSLKRPVKASWLTLFLAIGAVSAALIGNAVRNPEYLEIFLQYFIPTVLIVTIMLSRVALLQIALQSTRRLIQAIVKPLSKMVKSMREKVEEIESQQMVFFTRGENLANLNRVIQYIKLNEHTNRVKLVTVTSNPDEIPEKLRRDVEFLDEEYPKIDIEFVVVKGTFSPKLIQKLSKEWNIPTNFMFIGCPADNMAHSLAELGGVRVVI